MNVDDTPTCVARRTMMLTGTRIIPASPATSRRRLGRRPVSSMQNDTVAVLEEESFCALSRLHPEAKPVRTGARSLRQLVAGWHPAAHAVIRRDRGSERRIAQGALGANDIAKEAQVGQLDGVVELVAVDEEILGERIEEVEAIEATPGARRRLTDHEESVRYLQPFLRSSRDFDEVRALLDTHESQLRHRSGGDEDELADTRTHVEHSASARLAKQLRSASSHVDGGPEAARDGPDGQRVDGVERHVLGALLGGRPVVFVGDGAATPRE